MSTISEKVRKAIFAKSSPMVAAGRLTAIYHKLAGKKAVRPYGIFARQAPGAVKYNFGLTLAAEDDLWLFTVVTDEDSVPAGKEPEEFGEEMLSLWESTLGNSLTVTGNTVTWLARFSDAPSIEEKKGDRFIYLTRFLMRIVTE